MYNRRGQEVVEQDIQKSKELGVKLLEKNLSKLNYLLNQVKNV